MVNLFFASVRADIEGTGGAMMFSVTEASAKLIGTQDGVGVHIA
jgi:hypothetical protein